ncbi:stage V sporulation protein D [Clostridium fermenticellae]|uniref:Stage V sporulation protein D n=2 Tax=Clostridium fermenticellae TaxID=2068654 RepID=A0A386H7A3_9CLOT|nr:stage V sporulation protein D [Clostridium fermenticellae]
MSKIKKPKKRFLHIFIIISIVFLLIIARLGYIMIRMGPKYKAIAEQQQRSEVKINAKRGKILDRNGDELAVNSDAYQIDLDLKTLRETLKDEKMTFNDLSNKLAPILGMQPKDVLKIMNTTLTNGLPASSAVLKRQVDKSQADKVKALNVRGIILSADTKRYYTNDDFLSSVLGRVNLNGDGISGVELAYNKELAGTPGESTYEKDTKGNQLPYENADYVKPINGKDVVLTIDEVIQTYVEDIAQKALTSNNAEAVNVIVMNPGNGEILGMTSKPDINSKDNTLYKVRNVEDSFEPGSIFKVITSACALENNVGINDGYVCNGSLKIGNSVIHCWNWNGHGYESFGDIIKNSCNVGFMELGQKIGKDKLVDFSKKMGIGQKTGIDLPGESAGILRDVSKMNTVDLATMAFGQGVAVTQVQYMAAFNSIANGGTWVRPHIMKSIDHSDYNNKLIQDSKFNNYGKRNVYNSNLAANLRQYLEKVVTEGVGKNAYVDGLDIAGKTGTAQVANPENGGYTEGKYISSFVGMAPASNPKVTVLISIDSPSNGSYYASDTAAPFAKELFSEIFNYISIKGEQQVLQN